MKLAILQFSPELGKVESNLARASAIIDANPPQNLDLLVLPELAFSGYNHTRESIRPFLEHGSSGPSSIWAKSIATKYKCLVTVGFPEHLETLDSSSNDGLATASSGPVGYNSTMTYDHTGTLVAHYRKTHLYYTDESWAQASLDKWKIIPLNFHHAEKTLKVSFGICMDLNPHQFTAPWDAYELCNATIDNEADVLVLSMAWLTRFSHEQMYASPEMVSYPEPDTFNYWMSRLVPLIERRETTVVIFANRAGEEPGMDLACGGDDGVRYAGSSWIGQIGLNGEIGIWGILGRGQEGLLTIETNDAFIARYVLKRANNTSSDEQDDENEDE